MYLKTNLNNGNDTPMTSTFYDSRSHHGHFNALGNFIDILSILPKCVYLCGAMGVVSSYQPACSEFIVIFFL